MYRQDAGDDHGGHGQYNRPDRRLYGQRHHRTDLKHKHTPRVTVVAAATWRKTSSLMSM